MTIAIENNYTVAMMFDDQQVYMAYLTDAIKPVVFDRTGGYGQLSIPFVMAWVYEEEGWVIGLEALGIDEGDGLVIKAILQGLKAKETVVIKGQQITYASIFEIFIQLLTNEIREVNPHSRIEAILIQLPIEIETDHTLVIDDLSDQGSIKVQIIEGPYAGAAWLNQMDYWKDAMWINYNRQGIGAYLVTNGPSIRVEKVLGLDKVSLTRLESEVYEVIAKTYLEHIGQEVLKNSEEQMVGQMVQTYLPYWFKKQMEGQSLKVTYNQIFPPFQKVISHEELTLLADHYYKVISQCFTYLEHSFDQDRWFFTGEGFRLPWTRKLAKQIGGEAGIIQWEGQLFGLLYGQGMSKDVSIIEKANEALGILVGPKTNLSFYPLINADQDGMGHQQCVDLIVEAGEQSISLVKSLDHGEYHVIQTKSIEVYTTSHINRIRLTLKYQGPLDIEMSIKKLAL